MRVFVATPITQLQRHLCAKEWLAYCQRTREVLQVLRGVARYDVFCALEDEWWGEKLLEPAKAIERDFLEMKRADLFVCYMPKSVISSVFVEIGWASCLGKPIVICAPEGQVLPFLVEGLGAIVKVKFIHFRSDAELVELLPPVLRSLEAP